jgi:hypothetical protein
MLMLVGPTTCRYAPVPLMRTLSQATWDALLPLIKFVIDGSFD